MAFDAVYCWYWLAHSFDLICAPFTMQAAIQSVVTLDTLQQDLPDYSRVLEQKCRHPRCKYKAQVGFNGHCCEACGKTSQRKEPRHGNRCLHIEAGDLLADVEKQALGPTPWTWESNLAGQNLGYPAAQRVQTSTVPAGTPYRISVQLEVDPRMTCVVL